MVKPKNLGKNKYASSDRQHNAMANNMDARAEFDDFCNTVLPKLRRMVSENKGAGDMYSEFQALIAARVITEALTNGDAKTALMAAKEILDRGLGKAKETLDINSRYEKLSDADLDQLLKSEQAALLERESDDDDSRG